MSRFVLKKLAHAVVVLFLVSFALAFMLDLAPGDPAYAILGDNATPEQLAQVRADLGLNDPFYERYGRWLGDLVQGDFGESHRSHLAVTGMITERLPVTLELIGLTILVSLAISIPAAVHAAHKADGRFDRSWQSATSVIVAFPPFVTALVLVFVFALQLRYLPVTGWKPLSDGVFGNLRTAALPVVTMALYEIALYSRLLRADLISTLQEDFILVARAKGLRTNRVLFRHALRPSSFTLVTLVGLSLGRLIGGAIIIESLFALPGLGQLLLNSTLSKDVLVVQGIVMFVALGYIVINAMLDVAYRVLDPRVRTQEART